jgi:hypothetical protein
MNIVLLTTERVLVSLTTEEYIGIANALNEVCNGIHIADPEFRTRLGLTRESLLAVLAAIKCQPSMAQQSASEIADVWADGGVMVRAITVFGDPVEMGEREVQAFAERLQSAMREAS